MAIVDITPAASSYIKSLLAKADRRVLEIGVNGKGCNGMSYTFTPLSAEDLRTEDEKVDLGEGYTVVVPRECVLYLLGSTVDHEETFAVNRLAITNPMAASTCGCGTSFSPDFSKIDQVEPSRA